MLSKNKLESENGKWLSKIFISQNLQSMKITYLISIAENVWDEIR